MIIDIHEYPLIEIANKLGIPFSTKALDTGDIVAGRFIVERKTINDLIHSIITGRFRDQISRLKNADDPALVVEFNNFAIFNNSLFIVFKNKGNLLISKRLGVNPTILNAINVARERGITPFISISPEMTLRIFSTYEKSGSVALSHAPTIPSRKRTIHEIAFNILCALPGIGPKTAKEIISQSHGKTLLKILENIEKIVGGKRGERAKEALNTIL